jgi:hypothetical protein
VCILPCEEAFQLDLIRTKSICCRKVFASACGNHPWTCRPITRRQHARSRAHQILVTNKGKITTAPVVWNRRWPVGPVRLLMI